MTKKIGKIIMITSVVVFIVGVAASLIYNVVACVKGTQAIDEWYYEARAELKNDYKSEDADFDELYQAFQEKHNKLILNHMVGLLIEVFVSYFSFIILFGYGRLVEDSYERTQAAKQLNLILVDPNKPKPESNQEVSEEQTTNEADE